MSVYGELEGLELGLEVALLLALVLGCADLGEVFPVLFGLLEVLVPVFDVLGLDCERLAADAAFVDLGGEVGEVV